MQFLKKGGVSSPSENCSSVYLSFSEDNFLDGCLGLESSSDSTAEGSNESLI